MVRTQWRVTLALAPLSLVCFQEVSLVGTGQSGGHSGVHLGHRTAVLAGSAVRTPVGLRCAAGANRHRGVGAHGCLAVGGVAGSGFAGLVAGAVRAVGGLWVQPISWRWRWLLWPCLLPVCLLPQGWQIVPPPRTGQFTVMAVDIGQGTAVLLRTARHTLLFDTGGRLPTAWTWASGCWCHCCAAWVCANWTPCDQPCRHGPCRGYPSVLSAMPVHELRSTLTKGMKFGSGDSPSTDPCHMCPAWQVSGGDGMRVPFEVLHPVAELAAPGIASSPTRCPACCGCSPPIAMRAAYLTGDIQAAQEHAMLARQMAGQATPGAGDTLRSTLLIAPHHGSKTSSTQPFLEALRPVQTVVQVGRRNRYGHPAPVVMARYAALGLPIVSSPACGAYLWRSNQRPSAKAIRHTLRHPHGPCWGNAGAPCIRAIGTGVGRKRFPWPVRRG